MNKKFTVQQFGVDEKFNEEDKVIWEGEALNNSKGTQVTNRPLAKEKCCAI